MISAAIHTISKATFTFALCLTLSTGLITAMDNGKRHTVTVKNYLVQSAITIKKPVQFSDIEHTTYIGHRSCEIAPIHNETFSLIPQNKVPIPMRNNFESIPCKLSIPTGLGKEVSFDIPLIKEKEVIRISCPNPKSRHIIISKNDMINFAETNILQ